MNKSKTRKEQPLTSGKIKSVITKIVNNHTYREISINENISTRYISYIVQSLKEKRIIYITGQSCNQKRLLNRTMNDDDVSYVYTYVRTKSKMYYLKSKGSNKKDIKYIYNGTIFE